MTPQGRGNLADQSLELYTPRGPRRLVDQFRPEFQVRAASTDIKAIEGVWSKDCYRMHREGFQPKPGEVWLDIGSNVGAFGVLAHHFGAKVVSVEADRDNANMTAANLEHNNIENAQVLEAAVVPNEFRGEKVILHTLPENQRRHSIAREGRDTVAVEVQAVKIDSIVDQIRPDGVKISIEGAEIQLLQSWEIPSFVHYVVVEWNFKMDNRIHTLARGFERLAARFRKVDMSKQINFTKPTYDLFPANVHLYGWD